jgi:4-diphosphocytidyl-2-C-methyl-D-erythritol kinase
VVKSIAQGGQGGITLVAPAKINLRLSVISKRKDGYHEIDSLIQKIALADTITLRYGESGIRLACPGTDLPTGKANLAFRAAESFLGYITSHDSPGAIGIDIVLEKKIPVAAGLGGGSSDAATVLKGLNILLAAGLSTDELLQLARPLGADVPFFIYDWPAAWAGGIGDQLTIAEPLVNYHVVLVNPGFPVSTAWVYEHFALTSDADPFILARGRGTEGNGASRRFIIPDGLHNDLEAVTSRRFPEIKQIKRELQQGGAAGVLMSGSGPTVFGLFTDMDRAELSAAKLAGKYGDKVFLTEPYRQT